MPLRVISFKPPKSAPKAGSGPLRWLLERMSVERLQKRDHEAGKLPVRLLLSRSML